MVEMMLMQLMLVVTMATVGHPMLVWQIWEMEGQQPAGLSKRGPQSIYSTLGQTVFQKSCDMDISL